MIVRYTRPVMLISIHALRGEDDVAEEVKTKKKK